MNKIAVFTRVDTVEHNNIIVIGVAANKVTTRKVFRQRWECCVCVCVCVCERVNV